ncbi:hypothetical protein K1T71_015300 [Dendrolimus kikuchii]|nr:hypothetical protein K1T71_015300 [Dendrolimus kikuchii]
MSTSSNQAQADDNRYSENANIPYDLCRVGVRLPPFWPEEPAVWFAQIEGCFALSRITDDETKYHYVSAQLEHRYAAEVKDILTNPPATGKYETLKTELIKRLSASREKEVTQLLMHEELGDRRPSQFLRHLRHLAGKDIPDDFIRTIWTSRLPTSLQTVIASQPQSTLEALADLADKVHDLVPATPQVSAVDNIPGSVVDRIFKEIAELSRKVEALSANRREGRSRPRGRNQRSRSRTRTRSESNYRRFPVCFYHHKYGDGARTCVKPCNYQQGKASGSR